MRRRHLLFTASLAVPLTAARAQPRTVVIGAEDDWYPYSALRSGRAQGMTVELVAAAFAAVGIQARFEPMPYARCAAQTRMGQLVACFEAMRSDQIEADYLWPARPLFEERFLIYARKDAPAPPASGLQVRDLEGRKVAVTRGYEYGSEFDGNTRVERIVTNHDENSFRLVLRGRADYVLAPGSIARPLFQANPDLDGQFKVMGQVGPLRAYMTFSRQHPDAPSLLAAFDEGMRLIQANGVARGIQDRWRQFLPRP